MPTFEEFKGNVKRFIVLIFYLFTLWPYDAVRSFFPRKRKDIDGEVFFITGAGSGLGRGMAIKFASYGGTVICTDVNEETCVETAQQIKQNGGTAYSFRLDVSDRHAVYALANQIREEIGDVTILINNAGIVTGKSFLECPDEMMIKTIEVNTLAHFWTLKAFLPDMKKKNRGHIVTIASIAGITGSPQLVDYCASKHGIVGMTEALRIELNHEAPGIKMTNVCPWIINTGMFAGCTSCSPLLLPMLDPQYCIDTIVAGVLNDDKFIYIPRRLSLLVTAKSIMPTSVDLKVGEYFKLEEQLLNFTGRDAKKKVE